MEWTYNIQSCNEDESMYEGCPERVKYRLFSVINHNHIGDDASDERGHYYVDVQDWMTGKWYRCNDTEVTWLQAFSQKKGPDSDKHCCNLFYIDTRYWCANAQVIVDGFGTMMERYTSNLIVHEGSLKESGKGIH